jgi:hypothetical protein
MSGNGERRNRKNSAILFASIVLALVFQILTGTCKKSEEAGPSDKAQRNIEAAAGYTAMVVTELASRVYDRAVTIVESVAGPKPGNTEGELTYDDTTGWWSLSVDLNETRTVDIRVKFLDESGNFHRYFGSNTVRIDTTGQGAGTEGQFTYTMVITGVTPSYSTYEINGGGTSLYNGISTAYNIVGMAIAKNEDVYPENGQLLITQDDVTFSITFNGNQNLKVTYEYKGFLYTITIDLLTGEIS